MEPNGQVLQPVEMLFIFGKRTPDTPDDMVWGQMVWYGMVWYGMWHGIGMSGVWYGFFIPRYGSIGMELIHHLGMGYPQGTLNQGIDVPYRYPKMGDWSGCGHKKAYRMWCWHQHNLAYGQTMWSSWQTSLTWLCIKTERLLSNIS